MRGVTVTASEPLNGVLSPCPMPTFSVLIYFFFNLRVFIKDEPQQEEQKTLTSKDTQFAAIKLPKYIEGPHNTCFDV
jgi:hypothetical protein